MGFCLAHRRKVLLLSTGVLLPFIYMISVWFNVRGIWVVRVDVKENSCKKFNIEKTIANITEDIDLRQREKVMKARKLSILDASWFSSVGCWERNIPVSWRDLWAVFELGLWSILSMTLVVKTPWQSFEWQITLCLSNWAHALSPFNAYWQYPVIRNRKPKVIGFLNTRSTKIFHYLKQPSGQRWPLFQNTFIIYCVHYVIAFRVRFRLLIQNLLQIYAFTTFTIAFVDLFSWYVNDKL